MGHNALTFAERVGHVLLAVAAGILLYLWGGVDALVVVGFIAVILGIFFLLTRV